MKNVVSAMLCGVDLIRTMVLKKRSASIIRLTRNGEIGTMLAATAANCKEIQCEQKPHAVKTSNFTMHFTFIKSGIGIEESSFCK
jgi:hypothetical protein